jgi:hypothetical protein
MANQAQFLLQVSDFTLAGIDRTNRTIRVRGNAIPVIVPGSINTAVVVAGGSGWVVGDLFTLAGAPGAIFKVATVSAGAIATATVVNPGGGGTATVGAAATAIAPSVGTAATLTTTINAGGGGLLIITGFSIASNVVTFNVVNALTGGGGQAVVVQGFTGVYAYLNGLYTTTAATATGFTAALTAPNVGQTNNLYATATVQPTYVSGGVIVRNGFVDQLGLPRPIAGIGPVAIPTRLVIETKNASVLEYSTGIIQTNIGLTVRIFQASATAGEVAAGALPVDVLGFEAEFAAGAF